MSTSEENKKSPTERDVCTKFITPDLIKDRVDAGGHDVPERDVRRRYPRSLRNLFTLYIPEMDTVHFFDNSGASPSLIFRIEAGRESILDKSVYEQIRKQVKS